MNTDCSLQCMMCSTTRRVQTYESVSPRCSLPFCTGLFRAKGFVWFVQQRSQRYIFHLSGKQRVECGAEGPWLGPAGVQLVLIGQQTEQLQQLQQGLAACSAGSCACSSTSKQVPVGNADCSAPAGPQQEGGFYQQQPPKTAGADIICGTAVAVFAELVQQHPRFELLEQQQQDDLRSGSAAAGLVQFTAIGSALHGVVADEVRHRIIQPASLQF